MFPLGHREGARAVQGSRKQKNKVTCGHGARASVEQPAPSRPADLAGMLQELRLNPVTRERLVQSGGEPGKVSRETYTSRVSCIGINLTFCAAIELVVLLRVKWVVVSVRRRSRTAAWPQFQPKQTRAKRHGVVFPVHTRNTHNSTC